VMRQRPPFILLDDARESSAENACLLENPSHVFVAFQGEEVAKTLEAASEAQNTHGGTLAGYISYEAGLALEPKLVSLADGRCGANGPLIWLGLFLNETQIEPAKVSDWLSSQSAGPGSLGPMVPQLSLGGYQKAFERLKRAIDEGEIYQANLTYKLAGFYKGDPVAIYSKLRSAAAAGYSSLIFDGSHWILSLSPELFVSLEGDTAKVKPMKGTRIRGANPESDRKLAEELASSEKDRAENLMIVDLLRNDLSKVAAAGSIKVSEPFAVETFPTIHQMVSSINAKMKTGKSALDLIKALFPSGSISGAPKIKAMELISEVEKEARGPYCGAIGKIDANGNAIFNVAIRTLRLTPEENSQGRAIMGVGSAIVADSDVIAERRECEIKSSFIRSASSDVSVANCDLIETMLFEPKIGIKFLELHLARIENSARQLGFLFNGPIIREKIKTLCSGVDRPSKLRLLSSREGHFSIEFHSLAALKGKGEKCIALPLPVHPEDWRLRHKTTDRHFYSEALGVAKSEEADEAIFIHPEGYVTEGSFNNIFVKHNDILLTPPAQLGLLPGILRQSLINSGKAKETPLTLDDLNHGFLLGNSVRGLRNASLS
jgi:para-aminobenzoate synthetase/4-amino-4-deoxychorismate lyase